MPVVSILGAVVVATSALAARQAPPAPSDEELRSGAVSALALVQRSVTAWDNKRSCFSCHHQGLSLLALRLAKERGVPFDAAAARASTDKAFRSLGNIDYAVQAVEQIDPAMSTAFWLATAHRAGMRPNLVTSVYARTIANRQEPAGYWVTIDARPPQSYSLFTATAFALRAMQDYAPDSLRAEIRTRVERARSWLHTAEPRDTEDRTFQLFGLAWAGETSEALRPLVDRILAGQRRDGGWAQLPGLESDAYATGQTLVALHRAGRLPTTDAAWQKGVRFLLNAQKPDGSWLVRTRLHEQDLVSPPYFETGFPHGRDQIISCTGTAWAAMALMEALPSVAPDVTLFEPRSIELQVGQTKHTGEPPWMKVALFGGVDELKALLDGGLDANSGTPRGTTLLMMAASDPAKVRLLLARGADAKVVSEARHTALMVAANHRGAIDSMRLLLDAGASPAEPPRTTAAGRGSKSRVSPMLYAIWSSEIDKVALLLDRGATLPRRLSIGGGLVSVTPIELALFLRDLPMVKFLASRGADVNELGETGASPLTAAVLGNDLEMVRALIALGASVNQVDQQGETALMHAATIDYGDTAVLEALLGAGADRTLRSPDKRTARDLATTYRHESIGRALDR